MQKKNFNSEQAASFVKTGLECLGYYDIEEIRTYFLDDGEPHFDAYIGTSILYKGQPSKILKPLNKQEFVTLMRLGMVASGYDVSYIKVSIHEQKITFQTMINIAEFNYGHKKVKRK